MKRILLLLFLWMGLSLTAVSADDVRVVINSGHTGTVRFLDVDERENLLFSCGDDGTVRAWDTDTKKLVSLLQISHFPVLKIVLHPAKPQVAAVQKSGINSYRLSVWDWKQKRELYSKNLDGLPLHIDYSPKGSYLVYSKTSWDSLTFLQSSTGRELNYLSRGFGIVSHFAISPRENTILTYSSSGEIEYYDIEEGKRSYSFKTLPDLEKIEFTANLRFMAASDTERFLLIDLTNGKVLAETEMKNISTISANALTGDIMCLYPSGNETEVRVINVNSGELEEREIGITSDIIPGSGVFHINTLYIPKESGDIGFFTSMEEEEEGVIHRNRLAPIENLVFSDERLAFAAEDTIFRISSDFFQGTRRYLTSSYFEVENYETAYRGTLSVAALENERLLLWQKQPGIIEYFLPDPEEGAEIKKREFPSDLVQVTPYGKYLLTLENSGTCSLLDADTLKTVFSYPGFGIKTAALAGDNLFLGKSRASGFNASILRVNTVTGETVPVFDSSLMIYEAVYHEGQNKIYALTVERSGEATKTVLKSFQPPSFTRASELLSFEGEDLSAHIAIDPKTSELYTTLGFEGVTEIRNRYGTDSFTQREHIPRKPLLNNNLLYTINTDYSITVWNREERERIINFYMFEDLEWIALLADGRYYCSSDAEKYIGVYDGTKRIPLYKQRNLRIN